MHLPRLDIDNVSTFDISGVYFNLFSIFIVGTHLCRLTSTLFWINFNIFTGNLHFIRVYENKVFRKHNVRLI